MKKMVLPIQPREVISTVLCLGFLIYLPLRVSSAETAAAGAVVDLKTESQFRSEATTYDGAILAIGGIASMKLETPDDLKKALAILERERQKLKLHRSKLISIGIGDATLAGAVKKIAPDRQSAEALVKRLQADPKAVLKLDGAESVTTRIRRRAEADAATLRRVAARLKEAAEKIKANQTGWEPGSGAGEFRVLRAGFNAAEAEVTNPAPHPFATYMQDPLTIVFVSVVLAVYVFVAAKIIINLTVEEERDQVAECLAATDANLTACVATARLQPFPINLAAELLCYEVYLLRVAECYLS